MDPVILLVVVFGFGFAARIASLPPLVGFLLAGFVLGWLGFEPTPTTEALDDVGVTLLLFTIGLKLRLRTLARAEIWAGATLHLLLSLLVFGGFLGLLGAVLLPQLGLDARTVALLAFSLSFSSTVFAVKVLEDKSDTTALYGRIAVGILVMQDIFAVLFLATVTGELPSPWAVLLLALLFARPLLGALLDRVGYGELLVLLGIALALGLGYQLFAALGIKGDLGALVVGMLLAPHRKAGELYRALMVFKDLFLVFFFVNIGLTTEPGMRALGIAVLLLALIPLKSLGYFAVLTRFGLRGRTASLAAMALSSYSEFGLLVSTYAVARGWLGSEWLVALAIAVAGSFLAAAPLNSRAHSLHARFADGLRRFETAVPHADERPIVIGDAPVLVVGMGRVGTGAYDEIDHDRPGTVVGIDRDPDTVARHERAGRRVIAGDATDPDFWERTDGRERLGVVLLAMDSHAANLHVAEQMRGCPQELTVAATVRYDEETADLREAGVDAVFNLFGEAGAGFAESVDGVLRGRLGEAS